MLAREVGEEMLSRLQWMTLKPGIIVDLGCATGELSASLQSKYPDAQVIALDISEPMMHHVKDNNKVNPVCADAGSLPFANQSVDLLIANFLFFRQQDFPKILKEWKRVLRSDGLLMFSALGPDSFKQWRDILTPEIIPDLIDMHDVGDVLLQHQYADPVLDVDYYTLTYREQTKLFQELKMSGMLMAEPDLALASTITPNEEERWEVTYEVIIGHAFAPSADIEQGIVRVPISQLRRR